MLPFKDPLITGFIPNSLTCWATLANVTFRPIICKSSTSVNGYQSLTRKRKPVPHCNIWGDLWQLLSEKKSDRQIRGQEGHTGQPGQREQIEQHMGPEDQSNRKKYPKMHSRFGHFQCPKRKSKTNSQKTHTPN